MTSEVVPWASPSPGQPGLRGAVLAAGLGRRMHPLSSHHLPKPMFPLGGKVPMSELWIRRLVDSGIADVTMNLCVLGETIRQHFGSGQRFDASIDYVEEERPSGTLGGVCQLALGSQAKVVGGERPSSTVEPFAGSTVVAPSGDIVTNLGPDLLGELYQLHQRAGAALTMVLVPVPWDRRKDFGTVVLDRPRERAGELSVEGRIAEFREKDPESPSNLNNASIYLIEMDLLRALDGMRTAADPSLSAPFYDFGKHVFPAMLGRLDYQRLPKDWLLWGVQYDGQWFDVGNKRDYIGVHRHLLNGDLKVDLPYDRQPWGYLGKGVSLDLDRVNIEPPVVIGDGCVIEPGATLGPYAVLGDDWTVAGGASVRDSVLWQRYAFYPEQGLGIAVQERERVDRHLIEPGVCIDQSVVVGGTIDRDLSERTVDVRQDGSIEVMPLDFVPSGERA